jgi:hypothetical protein
MLTIYYGYQNLLIVRRLRVYRVIIKGKFKEKPITGSIKSEHISWWKQYWLRSINLEILQPKHGWITLVKVYREGKPSIRVITVPTSSDKRELFVMKQLHGGHNA